MADIHYHIERPGPRSRYIIAHLLGPMAGWHAVEIPDREAFRSMEGPKLLYGEQREEDAFQVKPHGLLGQTAISPLDPEIAWPQDLPLLFPSEGGDLPFDLFSAAFFQLARYEEYGTISRDEHGRPLSTALHAARHGYLQQPIVDQWFRLFVDVWRRRHPQLPAVRRKYAQTATMDVDNGAMYLGRAWWRSVGGGVRDLLRGHPRRVLDRMAVLGGSRPDPYAVHMAFLDLVERNHGRAIINFITAPRGRHDHAVGHDQPFMRAIVMAVAARAEVGLHPGYASSDTPSRIPEEKQQLEAVTGKPVTLSRQHFLRMQLPGTLRELERSGIREEHSMGLADRTGFRAGTCTAFPFYDLQREEPTSLLIHPFAVMDSALCYRMRLSPQEAVAEAVRMVDAVRAVQGTFISVWHERFLSDYGDQAGWGNVADQVISYAKP
ncbi:MAG: polysaccharide deacetylase family protein [Flavobacteriales bacterium]|jgi:hypothetical protein|nr:polysaccharide deacetylase family protein [Flavobacteriales bacterium]